MQNQGNKAEFRIMYGDSERQRGTIYGWLNQAKKRPLPERLRYAARGCSMTRENCFLRQCRGDPERTRKSERDIGKHRRHNFDLIRSTQCNPIEQKLDAGSVQANGPQIPATDKQQFSVISGELCGLCNSAQVVIEPPGKVAVERRIFRVPGETLAPPPNSCDFGAGESPRSVY